MYRLIVLLNIVGKIMDKVLIKRILFIADAYSLLLRTYTGKRVVTGYKYAVYLLLEKIYAV